MENAVMEYKCPSCGAGLHFSGDVHQLTCEYCDTTFEIDAVKAFNEDAAKKTAEEFSWKKTNEDGWKEGEEETLRAFLCPSCGAEIMADDHTAATFCPYCDNPTILPTRLSGSLRPDSVLPFKTTHEDAKKAFLNLCKGKPLLPKEFTAQHRLEKITGVYVPFWLYDCEAGFAGSFRATRITTWSDPHYIYTKTDHFLLQRGAEASFTGIPMDGSSKMDDAFMESIEPFHYDDLVPFEMGYLSGFLADKYDVPSEKGEDRIRQRVETTISDEVQRSVLGYNTCIPASRNLSVKDTSAKYVLLPVWMLNTKYNGKIYTFAMNGQTGKMTGEFPICPKRSAAWFGGVFAGVTALVTLLQLLV